MSNILIVLPYSGRSFGGGLAVFNQELTKALGVEHHVKLLIINLRDTAKEGIKSDINPKREDHGNVDIIPINDVPYEVNNPTANDGMREDQCARLAFQERTQPA
jgi:hypothetical protein